MPRVTLPRLTFLARFTLVTLAAAILASSILAFTLEAIHQNAVERDQIVDAVSQLNARLGAPLERYAHAGALDARAVAAFRAAQRDALLDQYVSDLRVYRIDGSPVFPAGAQADATARRAATADGFVTVDAGNTRTVYEPYVTSNGGRFVIAVDFLPDQLAAQFASERWQVVLATIGVIALIACALVALAAGASRELERRRRESQAMFVQTLTTLADTIDLRDPYTAGHSKRVAAYSKLLAEDLGLTVHDVEQIESGALMHDIGKVGVPDAVLFKPGALDADERMLIRGHPVIGAGILRGLPTMSEVVPCILHHHERVDGTGYPDGLCGEAIPLGARIIAVADAFDAMTTDRPYRRGLTVDAAVAELLAQEGTQFDRRCVLAFAELVLRGEIVPPPRAGGEVVFAQRPVVERLRAI
jgi:putative nucleotidyltransferase with HDIG domain